VETKDGKTNEVVINTSIGKIRIREHELGVCVEALDKQFTAILQSDVTRRQLRNFGTSRVILSMIQKKVDPDTCTICGQTIIRRKNKLKWCAKGHCTKED